MHAGITITDCFWTFNMTVICERTFVFPHGHFKRILVDSSNFRTFVRKYNLGLCLPHPIFYLETNISACSPTVGQRTYGRTFVNMTCTNFQVNAMMWYLSFATTDRVACLQVSYGLSYWNCAGSKCDLRILFWEELTNGRSYI